MYSGALGVFSRVGEQGLYHASARGVKVCWKFTKTNLTNSVSLERQGGRSRGAAWAEGARREARGMDRVFFSHGLKLESPPIDTGSETQV